MWSALVGIFRDVRPRAESFGGAGSVAPGETGWQVRSWHVLVQEASVETIAVARRVHGYDFLREAASGLALVFAWNEPNTVKIGET
jgi:hypothetical protein